MEKLKIEKGGTVTLKMAVDKDDSKMSKYVVMKSSFDPSTKMIRKDAIEIPMTENELKLAKSIFDGIILNGLISFTVINNGNKVASISIIAPMDISI